MKVDEFEFPDDLLYDENHLWIKADGTKATVGLTDLGQALYKGIMHIDLPEVGEEFPRGDTIAPFETIKSVSKIIAPLTCKISKVNEKLRENSEIINESPYGEGWILELELQKPEEKDSLMPISKAAEVYAEVIKKEKEKYAYLYE